MRVSLNWIKEFTSIDGTIGELVELIGSRLVEVEELIDWSERFKGVIVGEITHVEPHENADKLAIYKVNIGGETCQVVSGDQSLQVGDRVGYIGPGVTVPVTFDQPQPVVMQERPLRGVLSQGMFGSPHELCIGADHSSVAVLDRDIVAGTSLAEAYGLDDIIIDIDNKSFTHRPDCFGIIGLSREIAAIQDKQFTSPNWFTSDALQPAKKEQLPLKIRNEVPDLCSRYMAVSIADVQNRQSPWRIQSMLLRMGIRPINLIVDITNYLMLLTGQPLHAFDYDKVKQLQGADGPVELVVRHPNSDEELQLLDGRTVAPRKEAIVIAGAQQLLALGGVMGGASTEIDESTRNVIIEVATFDMYNVRSTSMEHGIFTDAVTRYAKGQSPTLCAPVLNHAIGMVAEYSPEAFVATEIVDDYQHPKVEQEIQLGAHWLNDFLGTTLEAEKIAAFLQHAECKVKIQGSELIITPPLWRSDLYIAEDIADEIGRLYGFDSITPTVVDRPAEPILPSAAEALELSLRNVLSAIGANEIVTYGFVSAKLMHQGSQDIADAFHLSNSISPELAYLRMSILPSLLSKVRVNHKAGFDAFALYEINKTHNRQERAEDGLPLERKSLAMVWSTKDGKYSATEQGAAFYQIKHYATTALDKVGVRNLEFRLLRPHTVESVPVWLRSKVGLFDLNRSAVVVHNDAIVGIVGEPAAEIRSSLKLPQAVGMAEYDMERLLAARSTKSTYSPLIHFPAIEQDICFKFPAEVHYGDVELYARDFMQSTELHSEVSPVDIYQKPNQPEHKQITIRIRMQHRERTLTMKEVNALLDKLADKVHQVLRGERV